MVINPANGPGSDRSPAYRHLVGSLQQGGSTVLMYIATGYFERPAGAVAADVDEATAGFGVDGVFFDEVPVDDTPTVTSMIGSLAALSPGHCVFNAGRSVPASWFGRWPHASFVTFEGSAGQFDERFGPEPKDRIVGPAERQTWLVHSLPRRSHARYWRRFAEAGVGSGYLTDDRLPNPWDVYVPRGR